jgi:inner membrane protein
VATPLGHSLAGYVVYKSFSGRHETKARAWLIASVFMANAPDLDFLPGLFLGQPALYHQGISHSLGSAIGAALVVAAVLAYFTGESFRPFFGLCFVAFLSHLVMDFLGPDNRLPHGIPFFWPISEMYFLSPVQLLLGTHHAGYDPTSAWEWFERLFNLHNLKALALEVAWFAPMIAVSHKENTKTVL